MTQSTIELSIVLPCLNEAATIAECVTRARKILAEAGRSGEVIVADNASTDDSAVLAAAAGARVIPAPLRGYGNALRAGLAAAQGATLVFLDADLSYDFNDVPKMLDALDAGADLVIGSRFRGGIDPGAMPFLHRVFGTPAMTALANRLFGCGISDINCGLRVLRRSAFDELDLHSEGMEFASEMMIKAALKGLRIDEIPIVLHPDKRNRAPHLHSFRDGWRHLQLMMHFCSISWYFVPAGVLLLLSMLLLGLAPATLVGLFCCGLSCLLFTLAFLIALLGIVAQGRVQGAKFAGRYPGFWIRLLRRWVKVEKGVVLGGLLSLVGLLLAGGALELNTEMLHEAARIEYNLSLLQLKIISLGAMFFIGGLELFSTSLFIGLFGIRVSEEELGLLDQE